MRKFKIQKNNFILASLLLCVILCISLYAYSVANAASNPQINYQGKLTLPSGVAVANGTYNMRFWLLTTQSIATTSALWTEQLTSTNRVQVTDGLFSVMLGSTSALTSVNFDQTLYLGVEVGGTAGTPAWDGEMSPRKIIGTVPSAFESKKLGGVASTSFVRSDEADTISASTAGTLLTVTQNGVGDILNLFDGAVEVFSVLDGGRVGIGSSTPGHKLTVGGSAYFGGNVVATGTVKFSALTASRGLFLDSESRATTTALSATILNSLTDETGTGVAVFGTAPTFTTSITSPAVLASSNDSGALGTSGTAFSDLFLASGGVINWFAGDATLTHSAGVLTVAGSGGGDLRVTTAGTNAASVVTVGGTQTLTSKTLTAPTITALTTSGVTTLSSQTASRALFTDASSRATTTALSATILNSLTDETGTGVAVFATSPTLVTPILGVAAATSLNTGGMATSASLTVTGLTSALTLTGANGTFAEYTGTSCTNQFTRSLSVLGVATCATVANTDLANSSVSYGGVSVSLGGSDATPAFDLTDATNLPIATGVSGLGSNVATFLATPSSANLISALTDETGTGSAVFGTAPTLASTTITGILKLSSQTASRALFTDSQSRATTTALSASLLNSLTDETGTGVAVFSASPTFTGTVLASAATLSSTLTMSGSAANIALGSNYLSGDGDDEGLAVDSEGDVGVGTTTSSAEMSIYRNTAGIADTLRLVNPSGGDGRGSSVTFWGGAQDVARIAGLRGASGGNSTLRFYTGISGTLTEQMRIDQSGVFGFGTTSPSAQFHFLNTGSSASFRVDDILADTSPFIISASGLVGIGTTTPAEELSVVGDFRLTGRIYDNANSAGTNGMVLKSTGTGFTWVATSTLGLGGSGGLASGDIDTCSELAAIMTGETGTCGSLVFSDSPTLTTPNLGTPSALVGTNITGTASGLTAGTVTTNANLTGAVTSTGNATILGSFTSADLLGAITNETGTGVAVFGTAPTLASTTITGILKLSSQTASRALFTDSQSRATTTALSATILNSLTDETGTGVAVFATSPTLVTPILGVAAATSLNTSGMATSASLTVTGLTSALTLTGANGTFAEYAGTSCTNQFTRSLSALGVATCATVANTDLANSSVSYGGVSVSLGGSDATPAFDLTDAINLPIATGVSGLGSNVATFLATPSSANLISALTDETGTGVAVFGTAPTLASTTITGILKLSSQTASRALFTDSQSRATTTALSATILNSLTDETGTGVAVFGTAPTFTTSITTPSVLASANDSGALGASGTAFSDLFLASGGVINWLSGDATLTHSAGVLTVAGSGGGDLRVTTAGTNSASVVTVAGTQTLTNKTLTAPTITALTTSGVTTLSSQTASRALFTDASSRATTTALSATILNSLTDETGTGVAVFSASPTFTGTITAAAATLSSTLTMSGTAANIALGSNYLSGDGDDEGILVDSTGNVGLGTTTPGSPFAIRKTGLTGSVFGGIKEYLGFVNSTLSAVYYGDSAYIVNAPTATSTLVGKMLRIEDSTALGNTVRGLEVQAHRGTNTKGENTALSGFARTFGVRGTTEGDAGQLFEPAGVFGQTRGTTQGNAIRGYSGTITTASLLSLFHDTSAFVGTGLEMNFGNSGGSFSSTTASKFLDLQNAGTSKFVVYQSGATTIIGTTTIGIGNTSIKAGLQIGFGGLCVDNDGSCSASTTGKITSVSSANANSDLAEMYFSSQSLQTGEIVYTDEFLSIRKADKDTEDKIIGVVSTKPGVTLGFDDTSLVALQKGYPVALSGRVPIRLSNENGPIKAGDKLALSSVPGVAMKATDSGTIVGIALEDYDGEFAYSEGFVNQFGDDIAEPVYDDEPVAIDPQTQDGCHYGAGGETGSPEEVCTPEVYVQTVDTQRVQAEARAIGRYNAEQRAIQALRTKLANSVTTEEGQTVKIGQIIMFVDLGFHMAPGEADVLAQLMSTSTDLVLGAGEDSGETLWSRVRTLAQNFVDGVLTLSGLKADKVQTNELCVDDVCINAEELRGLLNGTNNISSGTEDDSDSGNEDDQTGGTEGGTDEGSGDGNSEGAGSGGGGDVTENENEDSGSNEDGGVPPPSEAPPETDPPSEPLPEDEPQGDEGEPESPPEEPTV